MTSNTNLNACVNINECKLHCSVLDVVLKCLIKLLNQLCVPKSSPSVLSVALLSFSVSPPCGVSDIEADCNTIHLKHC